MQPAPISPALVAIVLSFWLSLPANAEVGNRMPRTMRVQQQADRLTIDCDGKPVATYVFRDDIVLRPYLANVFAPGGIPVTRHHPPREGMDAADHATMHPGIWLAFGDVSGADFWRNKGRVEHVEFVERPEAKVEGKDGVVSFAVRNHYVAGGKTICNEVACNSIRAMPNGTLFTFDSQFSGDAPFAFGDQEEMGLGIRLATPLVVKGGSGTIANSDGGKNEREVWGRAADWCDYSGIVTTKIEPATPGRNSQWKLRTGLLLIPHPDNFRRSWMHARDYGVLVANPFGQNAFSKGPKSSVEVKPGETFRLRFGVWAYSMNPHEKVDLAGKAAEYVRQAEQSPK